MTNHDGTARKAARNRLFDARTKPDRGEKLLADLAADLAYYSPEPLPALPVRSIPSRIKGEPIELDAYGATSIESAVDEAVRKVHAEMARLLRLAPPAPMPWAWRVELSQTEYDFMRDWASVQVRLVLEDTRTGERVDPVGALKAAWCAGE